MSGVRCLSRRRLLSPVSYRKAPHSLSRGLPTGATPPTALLLFLLSDRSEPPYPHARLHSSRQLGPFGCRRHDHPLHDHADPSPLEGWVSGECPTAGSLCLNWPLACTRCSAIRSVSAPYSMLWCLPYVPVLFLSTPVCSSCALPFLRRGGKRAGARAARFTGSC